MNDTSGMVLAAMHAQTLGAARVAIVDWDAHHGNGTQDEFYDDSSVLTISIHQDGRLPRASGSLAENGSGTGVGANINVPLPPGSGHGAYLASMADVVIPALESPAGIWPMPIPTKNPVMSAAVAAELGE